MEHLKGAHQNFHSISHPLGTVTALCIAIVNCRQHSDGAANGSVVTLLLAAVKSDYIATVQSLCSYCA